MAGGTVADKLICIKCPEIKREILKTFDGIERKKEERTRKLLLETFGRGIKRSKINKLDFGRRTIKARN